MSKKGRVNYNFTAQKQSIYRCRCLFVWELLDERNEEEGLKSAYVHNNKYEVMKMKG